MYNSLGVLVSSSLGAVEPYIFDYPYAEAIHIGGFAGASNDIGPIRDSAVATSEVSTGGVFEGDVAHGWAVMSGAVVAFTDLVGPTTVTAGEGSTWHGGASPSTSPPISFGYQWRVNGQNQSGATQSAYSNGFALPGAYTVGAIMTYADGVADTNTVTVTSVFGVHISGPNPLDPNQGEGHYEAVVPGGVAPFSYQWWLDGNPTSTSSSFDSFIGMPSSTHELKLRVADAQSHVANTTMSVFVTAGGTCLQPPCP